MWSDRPSSNSNNSEELSTSFSVPLFPLQVFSTVSPIAGLLLCVSLALWLHGDSATQTHCGVWNFWPSVSSAIGNRTPERYVWRAAVSLHVVFTMGDSWLMRHNLVAYGASATWAWLCAVSKVVCFLHLSMFDTHELSGCVPFVAGAFDLRFVDGEQGGA